ncbi:MAG: hypothetical protein JSR41_18545 [Proteobacteria bacterium]|nr:hypothetical protein [Pseudomonadota bacterium]
MDYVEFALTVIEAEEGQFHWVLMEPVDAEIDDELRYRPVDSSPEPFPSYSEALLYGSAAMRTRQNALREAVALHRGTRPSALAA